MRVGADVTRIDALDKVLGRAAYAADLRREGMLFACVLRSPRPHAFIRDIDPGEALALPGVVKVLTWRDIPGENRFGAIKRDQPYLAEDRVRYIGEPVALVVAERERVARKALDLIRVTYEDLEVVSGPFAAMGSSSLIHESGNLLSHRKVRKGDVERGFRESDVIVEHVYRTTWLDHGFLETEAGMGYMEESGRIVVTSSTQNIHYKRREISRILALPEEKVRVLQAVTGGGFGGKLDVTVEGFIALAVHHTGRPVMMRYTREESFLSNTKRHPLFIEYKTGVRRDGTIQAVKVNIIGDTGPYISYGETVCLRVAVHGAGPYEVPNIHVDSRMYYTNNPVSGAMRGFGVPQLAFAHESQLDTIAGILAMDPIDIRLKNGLRRGSLTATGQVLEHSAGFVDTLRKVEPYWRARKKKAPASGFGLGCMYYGCGNTGISNPSGCSVLLTEDGRIALRTGVCDIGQGSDTVLSQILGEALEVRGSDIILVKGDTDTSFDAGSSSASRQTYISGRAVMEGALKMREFLRAHGFYLGVPLKEIAVKMKDKGLPSFDGFFDPPTTPVDPETSRGTPYATYAFATHMTEVEVDETTGACRVVKVHAAHDVGKAVNVRNIRGQIYGGIAMGIGFALMEEFVPGASESLDTYYMPTAMDMPEVVTFLVEDGEPTGPFGAKGVGEPALIPQAASIVNAISDAVHVRPYELPCHIERLKGLLEEKKRR